jgi:hypothetical protein
MPCSRNRKEYVFYRMPLRRIYVLVSNQFQTRALIILWHTKLKSLNEGGGSSSKRGVLKPVPLGSPLFGTDTMTSQALAKEVLVIVGLLGDSLRA